MKILSIEVVAQAVGLGQIPHSTVDLRAIAGHFRVACEIGFRGVRPVPIEPNGGEDGMGRVTGNQHPRVCLPIGDVGDGNQTGVSDARDAPKAQFGGFAALAPRVQHQRLLPQMHLVIHPPRSHTKVRLDGIVRRFCGNQFAIRHHSRWRCRRTGRHHRREARMARRHSRAPLTHSVAPSPVDIRKPPIHPGRRSAIQNDGARASRTATLKFFSKFSGRIVSSRVGKGNVPGPVLVPTIWPR